MRHEIKHGTKRMEYEKALLFLIDERAGAGGWPPRDVHKVELWFSVRLIAKLFGKSRREVAMDLIDYDLAMTSEMRTTRWK